MSLRDEIFEMVNKNIQSAIEKIDPSFIDTPTAKTFRIINRPENTIIRKRVIVRNLGNEPVIIIPLADIHLGNKGCNLEKLEQIVKLINETPNCYTILLGDLTETATKTSIGLGIFDEDFHIDVQLASVKKILKPLAEQGKILGALIGNHEMRLAYTVNLNPTYMICESLDIPYLGYQGYLSLAVGNQTYRILATHGTGNASTPQGKIAAVRKLVNIADADIYLMGHVHGRMYDNDIIHEMDEQSGTVVPRIRHYVVCGSFLEYWGTYAEMKLLSPAITGSVMLVLDPDIKDVRIIL